MFNASKEVCDLVYLVQSTFSCSLKGELILEGVGRKREFRGRVTTGKIWYSYVNLSISFVI